MDGKRSGDFNLTVKPKTVVGYTGALKLVLRRVHEGDLERDKRIRGANSLLRNARSLFGQDAMKCYRGLSLPDLSGFLKATTAESSDVQHEETSTETIWDGEG